MLDTLIALYADLTHCTFQIGEGSRYNNRLVHTLISFRLIPLYTPLPLVGRDLRHTRVSCFTWVNTLTCGSVSLLRRRITLGRRATCDADLSRANDTFSLGISWPGNAQDRSFRHICSRLRRNGLMPARIE